MTTALYKMRQGMCQGKRTRQAVLNSQGFTHKIYSLLFTFKKSATSTAKVIGGVVNIQRRFFGPQGDVYGFQEWPMVKTIKCGGHKRSHSIMTKYWSEKGKNELTISISAQKMGRRKEGRGEKKRPCKTR